MIVYISINLLSFGGKNMQGNTHILGGIATGTIYLHYVGPVDGEVLFFSGLMFGALLPDIDHKSSKIGRAVPLIDNIISSAFGHRTFTHSLLILILGYWLFQTISLPVSLELGILLGMVNHILLDMLTVDGVKFLWPFKVRVGIPVGVKSGGPFEQALIVFFVIMIGYFGYQVYF
jgi:inner membrane protein